MVKNYVLAAMIGLGIAGLVFISKNTLDNASQSEVKGNNIIIDKPFVEKLAPGSEQTKTSQKENLTELFAQNIGKAITQSNPNGPADIDGKSGLMVPDIESISEQLVAEAAEKFDPETLRPEIKNSDLKISGNESKEALIAYFSSFKKILEENAAAFAKNLKITPEENFAQFTGQMIAMYRKSQKDFYGLEVPESLISVHKKEIELLGMAEAVLGQILNYENDPLSAIMASEYNETLDGEFAELKKEISQIMAEKNINI